MKTFKQFKNLSEANLDPKQWNQRRFNLLISAVDNGIELQVRRKDKGKFIKTTLKWVKPEYGESFKSWVNGNVEKVEINDPEDGWEYWKTKVLEDENGETYDLNNNIVKTPYFGGQSGLSDEEDVPGKKNVKKAEWFEVGITVGYNAIKDGLWDDNLNGGLGGIPEEELDKLFELSNISGDDDKKRYEDSKFYMDQVGKESYNTLKGLEAGYLLHSGKETGSIDKSQWEGGKPTYKSDIYFANGAGISVKKAGGSQFVSGLIEETVSTFKISNMLYSELDDQKEFLQLAEEVAEDFRNELQGDDKRLDLKSNVSELKDSFVNWLISKGKSDLDKFIKKLNVIYGDMPQTGKDKEKYGLTKKSRNRAKDGVFGTSNYKKSYKKFADAMVEIYANGGLSDKDQWTHKDFLITIEGQKNNQRDRFMEVWNSDFPSLYDKFISSPDIANVIKGDIQILFDRYEVHKKLNSRYNAIFNSNSWKKYFVFEGSTGCYKFGGKVGSGLKPNLSGSGSPKAIATHVLEFEPGASSEVNEINESYCEKYAKLVKVFCSFKTASGSPQSSVRATLPEQSEYSRVVDNIITEEFQFFEEHLLMEGIFGRAVATFKKVGEKLASVMKKIISRVTKWIIDIANKGIESFMEAFNVELDQIRVS